MERLTVRDSNGQAHATRVGYYDIIDKLASYEDAEENGTFVKPVDINDIKAILKETYLEIANNYSVDDLSSDSDKVSCVASAFRQKALEKLERFSK